MKLVPNKVHQVVDLFRLKLIAKRRHAIRPAIDNGGKNIRRLSAVDPDVVHERGTLVAASLRMTAAAVEPVKITLPARSVVLPLRNSINVGILNIRSLVFES